MPVAELAAAEQLAVLVLELSVGPAVVVLLVEQVVPLAIALEFVERLEPELELESLGRVHSPVALECFGFAPSSVIAVVGL